MNCFFLFSLNKCAQYFYCLHSSITKYMSDTQKGSKKDLSWKPNKLITLKSSVVSKIDFSERKEATSSDSLDVFKPMINF
jgi:hypothetical protein